MRFGRRRYHVYFSEEAGGAAGGTSAGTAGGDAAGTAAGGQAAAGQAGVAGQAGAEGAAGAQEPQAAGGANEEAKPTLPTYWTQFPKEKRDSEAYKAVAKFARLEDLADAYLASEKARGEMVKVPDGNSSTEEIKAFLSKIGVPEGGAYKIHGEKGFTPDMAGACNAFKEAAYKSGMTQEQTQNMWNFINALSKTGQARVDRMMENAKKTFDVQLEGLYKPATRSDEGSRLAAGHAVDNLYRFIEGTGCKAMMRSTGLCWNPQFVKALSDWMDKSIPTGGMSGGLSVGGGGDNGGVGAFGSTYSEEWKKAFGGRG